MRFTPIFVFIGLALLLAFMLLRQTTLRETDLVTDSPFPPLTLTSLDGKKTWSQDGLKNHTTLINFFASWCTPCLAEHPQLIALKKQFPTLQIHGVVWNDDAATMHAWLKKHGNPYDALWLDKNGDAAIGLGVRGIPESFLVDGEGMIRYRISSPIGADWHEGTLHDLLTRMPHAK